MQLVDLRHIHWERNLTSYTSGGAYFKASCVENGLRYYYKLSNYDDFNGFIGYESIYEYLASKLGLLLGFDVLDCEVLKAQISFNDREYVTYAQKTVDFLLENRSKTAFERHYELEREAGESRLDFLRRLGFNKQADQMLVFDYIIYNRDRHCNNLELIKNGALELAPLFDNGVSFFAPYAGKRDEIERFDVLSNSITNNDFGTRYLQDNLDLVQPGNVVLPDLSDTELEEGLYGLFKDDNGFEPWHQERTFELITKRLKHAQEILHN